MESLESSAGVGTVETLISGNENHAPASWANATARLILNTTDLTADRLQAAQDLQAKVGGILTAHYSHVIGREVDALNTFTDRCDCPYEISDIANVALFEIQLLDSPWSEMIRGNREWIDSALSTIGNHLSTAIHVQRLLHADQNPHNQAAAAYKRRFTG